MIINEFASDRDVMLEIGARLEALRLSRGLTQQELADRAGVSMMTVRRLEEGLGVTKLASFLAVCRVLGRVSGFDAILPLIGPQPIDLLKLKGKTRQRAPRARAKAAKPAVSPWREDHTNLIRVAETPQPYDASVKKKPWVWGEDR